MIDITGSTQFSGSFSVNELDQDESYSRGSLTGYPVAANGDISARYSNDESLVLGAGSIGQFHQSTRIKTDR